MLLRKLVLVMINQIWCANMDSNQDQICLVKIGEIYRLLGWSQVLITMFPREFVMKTKYGVQIWGNTLCLGPSWVLIAYITCPPVIAWASLRILLWRHPWTTLSIYYYMGFSVALAAEHNFLVRIYLRPLKKWALILIGLFLIRGPILYLSGIRNATYILHTSFELIFRSTTFIPGTALRTAVLR